MGASRTWTADTNRVQVGATANLNNIFDGGGTVSFWGNVDSYTTNRRVLSKLHSVGAEGWVLEYIPGTTSLQLYYYFSGSDLSDQITPSISTGEWHHITCSYNADSVSNAATFYIDGDVVASSVTGTPTGTRASDSLVDLYIGNIEDLSAAMRGGISHVQMWDRVLSAAEVKESMYKPGSIRTNLVGYWPVMGDSPERDLSGNGNTGTVTGTTISNDGPPITKF